MSSDETPPQGQTGELLSHETANVGFCAILGLPNAGKSTLLNRILGVRLVAVSRKPQTTRNRILGVHNVAADAGSSESEETSMPAAQIILMDTPGMQHGAGALRRFMRDQALSAAGDCDVAVLLVDVSDPGQRDPERLESSDMGDLLAALKPRQIPTIVALNKIDTVRGKDQLLPIIARYRDLDIAGEIVPISAQNGDGVEELVAAIARQLPVGPRLFPEDMLTDRAERFLAAELVREQLFHQLGQELPYAAAVVIEAFHERDEHKDIVIDAVIYVERDSQKGIVVGKQGRRIKAVGQQARAAIAQLFGCPVHLKLFVKVSSNWSRVERGIREMGYE